VRIRKTDEREALWDELQEATGEATLSKALDHAARHYIEDRQNKHRIANEIEPKHLEKLSTTALPIKAEISVGFDGETQ